MRKQRKALEGPVTMDELAAMLARVIHAEIRHALTRVAITGMVERDGQTPTEAWETMLDTIRRRSVAVTVREEGPGGV